VVGSLLVIPVAVFALALGASDEWSVTVAYAVVLGIPVVVWGVVVVVLVRYWLGGWRRLWGLPLVVFFGFLFWPTLLLLISSRVRRSVLPYKPPTPRTRADAPGLQLRKVWKGGNPPSRGAGARTP
jgi:hypothetical protein